MKQKRYFLALGLAAVGLSGLPHAATAQVPIERYFPFAEGNRWQYLYSQDTVLPCGGSNAQTSYVNVVAEADTVINGRDYHVFSCTRQRGDGTVIAQSREATSVDYSNGLYYWNTVSISGGDVCGFARTTRGSEYASYSMQPDVYSISGTTYTLDGVRKSFADYVPGTSGRGVRIERDYGADVGVLRSYFRDTSSPGSCLWSTAVLRWASVNGVTYGAAVSTEQGAPEHGALHLSLAPIPTYSTVQLSLSGADHATVAVYDLMGRRVYVGEIGGGALVLDTSGWGAGLYVARVTTTDGQTATARLVRSE